MMIVMMMMSGLDEMVIVYLVMVFCSFLIFLFWVLMKSLVNNLVMSLVRMKGLFIEVCL